MEHQVSIARNADPSAAVREALDLLGGIGSVVGRGESVVIKPNNVTSRYVPGTVTSAEVVAAVAQLVLDAGARPVIAENDLEYDGQAKDFGSSCACRYRSELDRLDIANRVALMNLTKDEMVPVELPRAKAFKKTRIARTVLAADAIIDVPVMKTHDQTQVTLGIKNLKGCLPVSERRRSHGLGVEQAIVDLCEFLRPRLVVIDGMTAAEGMGPTGGQPFKMDLVIAGRNPLATDMVGAAVMGFAIQDIHFLRNAIASGLGPADLGQVEVLGLPIESVRRSFITAQSVVLKQYQEMGINVIHRNVCSGCWAEFRHIYYSLRKERAKLAGITFVLGQVEAPPPADKTIVLGRCAAKAAACGVYVPGCPPHHTAIEKVACEAAGIDPATIDTYIDA